MSSRTSEALFIGYAFNQKGYKLYDDGKEKIVVSCNVVLDDRPCANADIGENEPSDSGGDIDDDRSPIYVSPKEASTSTPTSPQSVPDDHEDNTH